MESRILNLGKFAALFKEYKGFFLAAAGLFVGWGLSTTLLLYNGKELVNALVYLFFVVILPFCFSVASLFWLIRDRKSLKALRSSYLFGLFFSFGALASLLLTITVKDIAFGWATTLAVTPQELTSLLKPFAVWGKLCSSCTVSVDLAQASQFNRLGGTISSQQIANAKMLGEWWRFLALGIVVYGVLFRLILWVITLLLSKKRATLFVGEANPEVVIEQSANRAHKGANVLQNRKFRLLGYHIDNLESIGAKSSPSAKDIVVAVKSWEPPLLELFDYLAQLQKENPQSKISLYLLGLEGNKAKQSDIEIWQNKLAEFDLKYEVVA